MEPHELAQWMQQEHERIGELMRLLREKIAAVPKTRVDEWLGELRDRFEHIRAHLQKRMALKEHEGYLSGVLERRPTLSDTVDRLRHEHTELAKIADGIYRTLRESAPTDRLLLHDCCRRIEHFLTHVELHEGDENRLVLAVFTRDIGTEG